MTRVTRTLLALAAALPAAALPAPTLAVAAALPASTLAVAATTATPALAVAGTRPASPQARTAAITIPPVTLPSVTIPPLTTPPVDVPPVRTPVVTTPPVHVPAVSTPAITTPAVSTPAVEVPRVRPPAVPAPAPRLPATPVTSRAPATPRAPTASQAASPTPSAPSGGARATQRPPTEQGTRRDPRAIARPRAHRARGRLAPPTARRATTAVALRRPAAPRSADAAGAATGTARGSRPQRAVPAVDLAGPTRRPRLPGAVGEIVDALPRWVLGVFLGFALIAMLMAINAYLSARRARALGVQRAALLDDVGLLQTALLAAVPAHAGDAEVSVAYRPAAGPAAGGDFYDVITLGPSRTGVLLGDVSGHGREALRHAALVRYTVRTFLAAGHDPADALARADECLGSDLGGDFATVIAAVYDDDTHTLRYAKAGHHAPVVLGTAHDPDAEPVAPPLGAGFGIRPEDSELTLDPGSTVCLFTDGLIEARRDGVLLGRATLVELLGRGRPDGPELLDRVVAHADEVSDDLAVCLLRRP